MGLDTRPPPPPLEADGGGVVAVLPPSHLPPRAAAVSGADVAAAATTGVAAGSNARGGRDARPAVRRGAPAAARHAAAADRAADAATTIAGGEGQGAGCCQPNGLSPGVRERGTVPLPTSRATSMGWVPPGQWHGRRTDAASTLALDASGKCRGSSEGRPVVTLVGRRATSKSMHQRGAT